MKKIGFRTVTSSILIDYLTDEIEIISQLEKISSQIKIIQYKHSNITTLRISIIFNEKISISSLPGIINKIIFIKNISKKFSIRWLSLTLNSDQFENIENTPEIVKSIILKVPTIFVHLVVSKILNQFLNTLRKQ
mgnify:CR=1 FL=1